MPTQPRFVFRIVLLSSLLLGVMLACARTVAPSSDPWSVSGIKSTPQPSPGTTQEIAVEYSSFVPNLNAPILTPTPDRPHPLPQIRSEPEQYYVEAGDTLGRIAGEYNIALDELVKANELNNPDVLEIGQLLMIPAPTPGPRGPNFKIIPDSELVYGPASVSFDIQAFVQSRGGYLAQYFEELEGQTYSGAQVIERIAYEYSINPRLLLAVLEYQSGWVTRAEPDEETIDFPMGKTDNWRKGLYLQLAWAANNLNRGYYLWRVNGVAAWNLAEGEIVPVAPNINAGTAGVQHLFAQLYGRSAWEEAVGESGLYSLYNLFFGFPFHYAVEPLLPNGLAQPNLQLPFESGKTWSFTGGPHGGWGSGSGWAAIDFAPPGAALGCVSSDEWVVAVADGFILRASNGAVVQDLSVNGVEPDGLEQTGWTILYMHIESRDRVLPGTFVRAGERIGHPSCEGGVSTGTHLHMARRYNGEWISADQQMPFMLDGWVSRGTGYEYNGTLQKDGRLIEAMEGRFPDNAIQR